MYSLKVGKTTFQFFIDKFMFSEKQEKEMPSTYYVVSNNDLIRIAYLLVYSSQYDATK